MTKEEFEREYAYRSFKAIGWYAVPCDCGEDGCKGWRAITSFKGWVIAEPPEHRTCDMPPTREEKPNG